MEWRISMARLHHVLSRALSSQCLIRPSPPPSSARPTLPLHSQPPRPHGRSLPPFLAAASRYYASSISRRRRRGSAPPMLPRRRTAGRKGPIELNVQIGIEEALPDDPLVLSIAEALRNDGGKATKLSLHNLDNSEYTTRDPCISSVDKYDSVDVSLLLCDDGFIRKLNKEWRDEDHATDVLSMSQHIPGLHIPIVHGLLHLLGFDHELSEEAEEEMEKEEEQILNTLEWKGKGLIRSAYHFCTDRSPLQIIFMEMVSWRSIKKYTVYAGSYQLLASNFFAKILRTVLPPIATFKLLNLEGRDDFISESSPGIFLQPMQEDRIEGSKCRALIIVSLYTCLNNGTMFEHPSVDLLHTVHRETKVKVMPSVEDLLEYSSIQKLLFLGDAEEDLSVLRQRCSGLTEGKACVVKEQLNALEIVPLNASKGGGLRVLLDHLGITEDSDLEAIGDYQMAKQ
ncbi:hypothetical protein TRIUR3_20205 [Triticum urartu]|uniref:rRNA maturation factor n=1 Tax=Triticum urartu TaxID=4572 RepID=M7YQS4_TRIUA|nr:hypothetical protein TRIUR3_20205 [Triticum urartu]